MRIPVPNETPSGLRRALARADAGKTLSVDEATWLLSARGPALAEDPGVPPIRLHTLDCGRIDVEDMGMFSDAGEHDGTSGELVVPCFLVHHPDGYLLWDTGLGDHYAEVPDGQDMGGVRFRVAVTLRSQLERIGVEPSGVRYVAFSHFHLDHTGNAPRSAPRPGSSTVRKWSGPSARRRRWV
jgi:glyoxylase-like metal-dependent hydrolase (beta-lactamase superfamily II)